MDKNAIEDRNAEVFSLLPFHFRSGGFHVDSNPKLIGEWSYALSWYMINNSKTAVNKLFDRVNQDKLADEC